jgi:hypothetical protein
MALTPAYAFRTPDPEDVPAVPSDMQDLAEDIETELVRIDDAAADLADRVTALESGTGGSGWIVIGSGSAPAGHSFTIDLTDGGRFPSPPLWNQIEVRMRLDLTEENLVLARINSDASAVYRSGGYTVDGAGVAEEPWSYTANTVWAIGRTGTAGTNSLIFRLFASDFAPGLHTFQSTFSRESDSSSVNQIGHGHGSLMSGGMTITSLQFLGNSTADFVNCWWTATGLRLEHPA